MFKNKIVIDGLQYCRWDREYLESLHANNITAVHITLIYHENARETLERFGQWNRLFEEHHDLIMPVHTTKDILLAKEQNRVGIFFGAQNCSCIEDDISLVEIMKKLGLLIMQLTYNNQSLLATGCYEEHDNGITRFGKQVIEEMNRVGMIVDMSHSSERSTLEAIEYSSRPICISHANPTFAQASKRNKSDEVLKKLARNGGILGFSLYPFHLPNKSDCTLEQFCQMISDTANLIGVEHLGIGSDLCLNHPQSVLDWMRNGRWSKKMDYGEGSSANASWPKNPDWFQDSSGMENVYHGLKNHGFDDNEITMVIGENWLRFLEESLIPQTKHSHVKKLL